MMKATIKILAEGTEKRYKFLKRYVRDKNFPIILI